MAVGIVKQVKLWKTLEEKLSPRDIIVIEDACNDAEDLLSRIIETFPTYTLHNATHCRNVCDNINDLLGDQVSKLTGLEAALLILSAFYHDIGMVYDPEEKSALLESQEFKDFKKTMTMPI